MSEAFASDGTAPEEPVESLRVGVLSFHNSKETKAILNAVRALGYEPVWLREENTRTWMEEGVLHFRPDVDVVVNRLLATKSPHPLDDLGVATSYAAGRPVLNPPGTVMRATHKYSAAATLAGAGLPVPDAYMAFDHRTIDDDCNPLEGRTVHKPAIGTNGERMALVDGNDPVSPQIARSRAFLQQFLDTDAEQPFDVRVYVVGSRIVGAMKRYAPADEWRTNVAQGGDVEGITDSLPAEAARIATRATAVLDLDYAGVDLLYRDGSWYVLEVNATAGFKGLFEATGTSPAPYIARLAIEQADGQVKIGRVANLATTLDDSIPDCKPSTGPRPDSQGTIGYTERVAVSSGRDIERTVAKADTGASRTSIDTDIAAKIDAGPIVDTTRVKSGTRNGRQKRPLVELDIRIGDQWQTTTASIEDRGHLSYSVLLGRDVLRGYCVDINQRVQEE